jgi:hypothetical protein
LLQANAILRSCCERSFNDFPALFALAFFACSRAPKISEFSLEISPTQVNGKAMANSYKSISAVTRQEWWESAEKVLDMKLVAGAYFGVTPAFLARDVVLGMRKRLETVHSTEWSTFLLENVSAVHFTCKLFIFTSFAFLVGGGEFCFESQLQFLLSNFGNGNVLPFSGVHIHFH